MVSPEMEANILAAIKEIKKVMEVRSMREMYHQLLLQEKQSAYLQSIYVELKRTVDQLKNDYPPRVFFQSYSVQLTNESMIPTLHKPTLPITRFEERKRLREEEVT